MASTNISFDQIPSSIRKPGKYFEFNTTNAVRTLAANSQKMLIIAQKAEDSDAPLVPVQIYDDATAGALFGYGSQAPPSAPTSTWTCPCCPCPRTRRAWPPAASWS